ncbi:MAG: hypothetical protein EOO68_22750, partial [Moraxellaceae bacterium]
MDGDLSRYSYNAPQNLALYAQQTGRQAPSAYASGQTPALIKSERWANYYEWFNQLNDRTQMTGEWLAYCSACPVPEIANVFR